MGANSYKRRGSSGILGQSGPQQPMMGRGIDEVARKMRLEAAQNLPSLGGRMMMPGGMISSPVGGAGFNQNGQWYQPNDGNSYAQGGQRPGPGGGGVMTSGGMTSSFAGGAQPMINRPPSGLFRLMKLLGGQ